MRSIFGLGKKVQQKLSAERFHFSFTIHQLSPWPGGDKAIAIGWQRGKKKRGATRSVFASAIPGKIGAVVRFNERIDMKASLYKTHAGNGTSSSLGTFKKKCLILAILETDGKTQATAALGRVVIDLAEFAAVDNQETRTFLVACNKSIQAAVGDPMLSITIRCSWKEEGPDGQVDEAGSVSTDTTGSRMTSNLSSFLRFKHTKGGTANEEQDLSNFDPATPKFKAMSAVSTSMAGLPMGTIPEEGSPGSADSRPTTGHVNGEAAAAAVSMGQSLRSIHAQPSASSQPGPHLTEHTSGSKPSGGIMQMLGLRKQFDEASSSPTKASSFSPLPTSGLSSSVMEIELIASAALEASVHLSRIAATARGASSERKAHACARRIARTMLLMGPQQGAAFGRQALEIIKLHASLAFDIRTLGFWLSNAAFLRSFLYRSGSSSEGGAAPTTGTGPLFSPSSAWAYHEVAPKAIKVESSIFDIISRLGWEVLLAGAQSLRQASAAPSTTALSSSGLKVPSSISVSKRAVSEAAIKVWSGGLEALSAWLEKGLQGGGASGSRSGSLLRQQVIHSCLRRLDAVLFQHLLTLPEDKGSVNVLEEYGGAPDVLWGASHSPPALDEALLPFTRGLLSFGCGMGIKMAVTRLQQAALAGDSGLLQDASSGSVHFPLLRATSDLLMMPKELLLEESIRRESSQSLSLKSIAYILSKFTMDEYSADGIPPEVLDSIAHERILAPNARPPLSDLSLTYKALSEDALMPGGVVQGEPGVLFDAESGDEIEGLGKMLGAEKRMSMLKSFWSASK